MRISTFRVVLTMISEYATLMKHHDLWRLGLQLVTQYLLYTYVVFRKSLQHLFRSGRQMVIFTGIVLVYVNLYA